MSVRDKYLTGLIVSSLYFRSETHQTCSSDASGFRVVGLVKFDKVSTGGGNKASFNEFNVAIDTSLSGPNSVG